MEDDKSMANQNQDEKNENKANEINNCNHANDKLPVDTWLLNYYQRGLRMYITSYLKKNTSDLEYYSLWRVKLYGKEQVANVMVDYLMANNYQMPCDEDYTKWDEDVHYSLMEVVGQYFK